MIISIGTHVAADIKIFVNIFSILQVFKISTIKPKSPVYFYVLDMNFDVL